MIVSAIEYTVPTRDRNSPTIDVTCRRAPLLPACTPQPPSSIHAPRKKLPAVKGRQEDQPGGSSRSSAGKSGTSSAVYGLLHPDCWSHSCCTQRPCNAGLLRCVLSHDSRYAASDAGSV